MLENHPLQPNLRASDQLSSRHRDFARGRLIKTGPGVQTCRQASVLRHHRGNAQGTQGLHQPSIDQPVRGPEAPPPRERKDDGIRKLPIVQHSPSTRRPAYELNASIVTSRRIVADASRLVAAKGDGGTTPPVDAKHRLARTQTSRERVIHRHVLRTGSGRVDENPPLERLGIERTPPWGATGLVGPRRAWRREARDNRQSSYDPFPGSTISTRARSPTREAKASTSCSI